MTLAHKILFLGVMITLLPALTLAQGGRIQDIVFRSGIGIGGVNVAVCAPLATTAASVSGNLVTFTMSSNPVTAGFAQGGTIWTAGFTGGDTYLNVGTFTGTGISGGLTILSVTPTTIIATLVHANASAGSNGAVLQMGTTIIPCGGKVTLYTDSTLSVPSVNPVVSDGYGNFGYWVPPGQYYYQMYGPTVSTTLRAVTVAGQGITQNCNATTGGLVPTPPNDASQSLLGNCTFGPNAGSYGSVIDAKNFGAIPGGQRFDASFNSSTTISFPNGDCPTTAQVGWLIFGTSHPLTFSGNGSLLVPLGTITSVCTLTSGTLSVSIAATGNCTPNPTAPGTACDIRYSPDNSTPLINAWNAELASSCIPMVLSTGTYLVKKGQFNGIPPHPGLCAVAGNVTYQAPTLTSIGQLPGGTVIVPTPDFDITTGAGNSCGGGDTFVGFFGCFFGSPGIQINGIQIDGAGQPMAGIHGFVIANITGGQYFNTPILSNVLITAWAAQAISSTGIRVGHISQAYLYNVVDNAAGGTPCEFGGTPGNVGIVMIGGACANGGNDSPTGPSCMHNTGTLNTHGVIFASVAYTGNQYCVEQDSGIWNSSQDDIYFFNTFFTNFDMVIKGGVVNLNQDLISDPQSSGGIVNGIVQFGPSTIQMSNTVVSTALLAGSRALNTQASAQMIDLGGNTIVTNVANTFTAGTLFGFLFVSQVTPPTIASGFGTSPSIASGTQPSSFTINVGTSNTGTGVLTLPAAPMGWSCTATDKTTTSANVAVTKVVPTSVTSVTFQNYSDVMATHAWVDSDILNVQCNPY